MARVNIPTNADKLIHLSQAVLATGQSGKSFGEGVRPGPLARLERLLFDARVVQRIDQR